MNRNRPLRRSSRLLAVMAGALVLLSAAPALAAIKIQTAYFDPYRGPDPNTNAGRNKEYIVIRNTGSHAVSLTGWTLSDKARPTTPSHVYKFPRFTLGGGKSVRVHTGKGRNNRTDLYWGSNVYVWGDDSDTATLKNGRGAKVDSCSWGTRDSSPKAC